MGYRGRRFALTTLAAGAEAAFGLRIGFLRRYPFGVLEGIKDQQVLPAGQGRFFAVKAQEKAAGGVLGPPPGGPKYPAFNPQKISRVKAPSRGGHGVPFNPG